MNYGQTSDQELMLLVKYQNDGDAYEELYSRYSGMSLKICLRTTGNLADAEDLNQEGWAKVWRRRETFRDDGVFKAWLIVISVSICRDYLRKIRRIREITREGPEDETVEQWLDRLSHQAERHYQSTKEAEAVQRAWNRLSAEDQKLLRQAYVDELSQTVMAKEREISIPTLRKRLAAARERFRLNLSQEGIQVADPRDIISATEAESEVQSENSQDQSEGVEN